MMMMMMMMIIIIIIIITKSNPDIPRRDNLDSQTSLCHNETHSFG